MSKKQTDTPVRPVSVLAHTITSIPPGTRAAQENTSRPSKKTVKTIVHFGLLSWLWAGVPFGVDSCIYVCLCG